MRIIACFFVIFNHTGVNGFFLFSLYSPHTFSYWIYLFFSIFCKFSVPLFLCISGALLLNNTKNESISYTTRHRLFRFLIVLTFFSFFYYLLETHHQHQQINLITFIYGLISKNWNFSYWYLYLLISFLLVLPLLCKLTKNLTTNNYYYIFSCFIFFSPILSLLNFIDIPINQYLIPSFFNSMIIIYPLLGYFLEHLFNKNITPKIIIKIWIINIFFIILSTLLTYYKAIITGECSEAKSQDFHSIFVIINCISIYITTKYLTNKIKFNHFAQKIIILLGRCSFGIYLFHIFAMMILNKINILTFFKDTLSFPPFLSILIYCLFTLVLSFIFTYLLKKVPLFNKYL